MKNLGYAILGFMIIGIFIFLVINLLGLFASFAAWDITLFFNIYDANSDGWIVARGAGLMSFFIIWIVTAIKDEPMWDW